MNVLFLSASMGGGHAKTAEAVIEYIGGKASDTGTTVVDTLKYISPVVDRLVAGVYLYTVRNTPHVYGKLYDISEKGERISNLTKSFNKMLSGKLTGLVKEAGPDVIVCTHSFPLQMLSNLKVKGAVRAPVIGIVTDFVNHPFWKLDGVDAFIVAHEYIKLDMIRMGIPADRIHTTGIPVSGRFLEKPDRSHLLAGFGLQHKPTVLLMGGSLGYGEVSDVFASLIKCKRDIQIIAVSGCNTRLKKQLESLACGSGKSTRIFGYTDRIPELMEISDFIVTKPGGVTISEALVKKLPILLTAPIPGQEVRNARFLVNSGAAAQLSGIIKMEDIFCQIIDNPVRVRHMKEMAGLLAKPNAARDAAELVKSMRNTAGVFTARISS